MGSFQAQTEQGVLEGIAAFLDHGGLTYRVMGYTVQGRLRDYQNAFLRFIRSFEILTDRAALSVEPMRIQLYTLERASSVAEISRRKTSPASEARLAILNGVEETERIPAGTTIKWVVGERPPGTRED